jgi:hypothetical protein
MAHKMHLILISIILCSICYGTDVYVDTDVSGGNGDGTDWANAYSKLSTAIVARAGVLTEDINFYLKASAGTADSNEVTVNGYSGDYYVNIIQADMPTDGVYDPNKYRLSLNPFVACLYIYDNYVRIKMQINLIATTGAGRAAINIENISAANNIVIYDSILYGTCSGTGEGRGIYANDADAICTIKNTIIQGFKSGSDTGFMGINGNNYNTLNVWNTTITNCGYGISEAKLTSSVINCAVFNNNDDFVNFDDANSINYRASDDVDGVNSVDISPSVSEVDDWTLAFTDYVNGDFSIKNASSVLYNAGIDLTSSGVITDIIGTARPQATTYDIGAYEFQDTTPVVVKPQILNFSQY